MRGFFVFQDFCFERVEISFPRERFEYVNNSLSFVFVI